MNRSLHVDTEREKLGYPWDLGDPQRKNGQDMRVGLCQMRRTFSGQGRLDNLTPLPKTHIPQGHSMKKGMVV